MKLISKIKGVIILIIAYCSVTYAAPSATSGIEEADRFYSEQKYNEAVIAYESAIEKHGVSSALLYNLGNACYKADKPAEAVIAYERALRLDPGNDEIINNLTYVRNRIDDRNKSELRGKNIVVTPDAPTFFSGVYSSIARETSSYYWALLAAFSFVLAVSFFALYIYIRNVSARKFGFFGSLLFISFTVVFLVFSFMAAKEYSAHDDGVITAYKVELLSEPEDNAKVSSTPLNAGTELRLLETQTDAKGNPVWYKVRLNAEFSGWIKSKDFELI